MHGERIGLNQSPAVAVGYVLMAVFLAACAKFAPGAAAPAASEAKHAAPQLAEVA
jgi:adenine/guanine/hypoxanthine permease